MGNNTLKISNSSEVLLLSEFFAEQDTFLLYLEILIMISLHKSTASHDSLY